MGEIEIKEKMCNQTKVVDGDSSIFNDFLKKLMLIKSNQEASGDNELGHEEADVILCEIAANHFLNINQRETLVDLYKSIKKWYS